MRPAPIGVESDGGVEGGAASGGGACGDGERWVGFWGVGAGLLGGDEGRQERSGEEGLGSHFEMSTKKQGRKE